MSSFSSILNSLGGGAQTPQQSSSTQQKPSQQGNDIRKLTSATSSVKLSANNTAAGVKRKSQEPESAPRPKTTRAESGDGANKPAQSAPSSRYQLSGKGATAPRPPVARQDSASRPTNTANLQRPIKRPTAPSASRPATTSSSTAPSTANGAAPPKRGFAGVMERAKAAQEAAKSGGVDSIKHKPAERLTKRDRMRMMEEAKEQQKDAKRRKPIPVDRSRSGTPVKSKSGPTETSFKGTMKMKAEPLAYKGTMRALGPGESKEKEKAKTKGQAQDKYGGYASWSDLDDAEDEEEDYGSDGSSDMEGGWDDVAKEEELALKAARIEDQKALEEEEAHRKAKLERKRRLEQLSKSAAAKRKY